MIAQVQAFEASLDSRETPAGKKEGREEKGPFHRQIARYTYKHGTQPPKECWGLTCQSP